MDQSEKDRYQALKRTHQQLLRDWKRKKGPCIMCAEREGNDKDHLPPEVLFPESIRTPETEFFTFPVCKQCNNASCDEDFLFSVALSVGLNQDSLLRNEEPTDPDLLALYQQTQCHLFDPKEADRRKNLLQPFVAIDPKTGRPAINFDRLPVNQTLTKIVKSIYWLNTGGDILQRYNPGWWIRRGVDTAKPHFIERHLKTSDFEMHWGDRFITRFTIGHPENGVGGFITASLHFYTKRIVGKGLSWVVFASPSKTLVDGKSLYEWSTSIWGLATIAPSLGEHEQSGLSAL